MRHVILILFLTFASRAAEVPVPENKGSLGQWAAKIDLEPKFQGRIEHGGKTYFFTDLAQLTVGGPSEHFILIQDDGPDLLTIAFDSEVAGRHARVPYIRIGSGTCPLSAPGVYFLTRAGDRVHLTFDVPWQPKFDTEKVVRSFIALVMDRSSHHISMEMFYPVVRGFGPNKAPDPTPTAVTPPAAQESRRP